MKQAAAVGAWLDEYVMWAGNVAEVLDLEVCVEIDKQPSGSEAAH